MASFQGDLYVGLDSGRAAGKGKCFKYDGSEWVDCGAPDGANVENLLPLGGTLYGATHGSVFCYEGGQEWACVGDHPVGITQIHSLDVYRGRLHVGTWPQGYVLRYEGGKEWTITGRLGLPERGRQCHEINDLVMHNGKLYPGVNAALAVLATNGWPGGSRWIRSLLLRFPSIFSNPSPLW
jgi:hypothetical protein